MRARYPLTRTVVVAVLVSGILYCPWLDVSLAFLGLSLLCLLAVWARYRSLIFPKLFAVSLSLTVLPLYFGILLASSHCSKPGNLLVDLLPTFACEPLIAIRAASNRASMLVLGYAWMNSLTLPDVTRIIRGASRIFGRHGAFVQEFGLTVITACLRFFATLQITYESLLVRRERQRSIKRRISQWMTFRRLQLFATVFQLSRMIQSLSYASSQSAVRGRSLAPSIKLINCSIDASAGPHESWKASFAVATPSTTWFPESATSSRPIRAFTLSGYLPRIEGAPAQYCCEYGFDGGSISSRTARLDSITAFLAYASRDFTLVHALPTVQDQLASGAVARSGVVSLARDFGLEHLLDRNCLELSGGETVLVSLGSALLSDKQVVIADAPFEALSENRRAALRAVVRNTISAGKALLLEARYQGLMSDAAPKVGETVAPETNLEQPETRAPVSEPVVLALRDAGVQNGKRSLLSHVSFELRRGELMGLRGENGIGKTTLLKMVAGLSPSSRQTIVRPEKVRMSFQQSSEQLVARTVRQELSAADELNQEPASTFDSRYAELGTLLPLPDFAASTEDLSPAQRRWLCIAAMLPADVLLLDEPNVDWKDETARNMEILKTLCRATGVAVLTVSHSEELLRTCDRVLDAGAWVAARGAS